MPSETMKAVVYHKPKEFEVLQVPIPQVGDDQVLLKVSYCGVCGSDIKIHDTADFMTKFPVIPGHEVAGVIEEMGKNVKGFAKGDRCVADPMIACEFCFYCRRGEYVRCENVGAHGITLPGGLAEYCVFEANKLHKFKNISDEEAAFAEPTACAVHGLDRLGPAVGIDALVIGAGPSGFILAQLLKLNGATRVVVAANKGIKTEIAKKLNAGHEYVELDRDDPSEQWKKLKEDNPYGFDVVVDASGSVEVIKDAINYVRRGGTLLAYSLHNNTTRVDWLPAKIFVDEIRIISAFGQFHSLGRAVAYLESGSLNVKDMITDVYTLDEYQKASDRLRDRGAAKIIVKPWG